MNHRDFKALEERTKTLFDRSVAKLDASTRSRLTQARYAALARARKPSIRWRVWVPTGAVAATLVAITLMPFTPLGTSTIALDNTALDDLEILADSEPLELLEDVEFYAWLDAQELGEQG